MPGKKLNLRRVVLSHEAMKTVTNPPPEVKAAMRKAANFITAEMVKNMGVLSNKNAPAHKKGPGPKTVTMQRKGRFVVTGTT
jgi:hypothetical protein